MWSRFARQGPLVAVSIGVAIAGLHLLFLTNFFTGLEVSPDKLKVMYMEDLLEASRWMKPRLASVDAVFPYELQYVKCNPVHLHSNWQRV